MFRYSFEVVKFLVANAAFQIGYVYFGVLVLAERYFRVGVAVDVVILLTVLPIERRIQELFAAERADHSVGTRWPKRICSRILDYRRHSFRSQCVFACL